MLRDALSELSHTGNVEVVQKVSAYTFFDYTHTIPCN